MPCSEGIKFIHTRRSCDLPKMQIPFQRSRPRPGRPEVQEDFDPRTGKADGGGTGEEEIDYERG